jgi:hypothetical protein
MIYHRVVWKYVNDELYQSQTPITGQPCEIPGYLHLGDGGKITIERGYAFDGPSGFLPRGGIFGFDGTFDTPAFMAPAMVHDGFYQLMREGRLPQSCRLEADRLLRDQCLNRGMSKIRAGYVYLAVRAFGASSAAYRVPKVITAP